MHLALFGCAAHLFALAAAGELLANQAEVSQNPEPARPKIPQRFSADITFATFDTGYLQTGTGFFAQDAGRKVMRVETQRPCLGMQHLLTNMTALVMEKESFDMSGGKDPICRKLPFFGQQRFADLFSWSSQPHLSVYLGRQHSAGKPCDLWRTKPDRTDMKISLCADGDAPLELNVTLPRNNSGGTIYNFSYHFGPLKLGSEVPEQLFQQPSICETLMPSCENGRGQKPVLLDAYIYHPGQSAADYNIEDQDVADLEGDAVFICTMSLAHAGPLDHNYTLISRYSLEISPAFGQYAACNGYLDTHPSGPICVGGDLRLVGREGAFSFGEGEKRCAAESPVGFWYALPKKGRCPAGESPTVNAWAGGCTWSSRKRVKTIHQDCLLKDHGYLQQCQADMAEQKGFTRSFKALRSAFASEDPSIGGCPDIGGPAEWAVVV